MSSKEKDMIVKPETKIQKTHEINLNSKQSFYNTSQPLPNVQ
jgi:hypothetical protein